MRIGNYKQSYNELVALTDNWVVWAWAAVFLAALAAMPWMANVYYLLIATAICIQIVGVLGLNILVGKAGLISLGYSGFLCVGAYSSVIVTIDLGIPQPFGLLFGGGVAAVLGLLIGIPSLRLKGLYLAITTMAFSFIVSLAVLEGGELTRASEGILVPELYVAGLNISSSIAFYYFCLLFAIGATLLTINLGRSRTGRAMLAINEYDIAARAMGIDIVRYKLIAFVVSSFMIGVSGGLYAYQIKYLNVDNFGLVISIEVIAMIIVGGLGSVLGSISGVIIMNLLPEIVRIVSLYFSGSLANIFSTNAIEIRGVILGLMIILFLRFEPAGFAGVWRETKRIWSQWPFAR